MGTYTNPYGNGILDDKTLGSYNNPFASTTKKISGNTVNASINPSSAKMPSASTKTAKGDAKGGGKRMGAGAQRALSAVGSITGSLSNMNGSIDSVTAQTREGIRGAISSMGPWGAAIGAATGVVDAIADMTGVALNTIDKGAADRADVGSAAAANNMIASLPGVSLLGAFAGKTIDSEKSHYIDQMVSGYSASAKDIDAAQKLGGKRTLFGKDKINDFIKEQNRVNSLMTSIGIQSEMARQNDAGQLYQQQNLNKYAGYSPRLLMAKSGTKFQELDSARVLLQRLTDKKARGLNINSLLTDIMSLFNPDPGANTAATISKFVASTKDGIQPKDISTLTKDSLYDSEKDPQAIGAKIVETVVAHKPELQKVFKKNGLEKYLTILDDPNNLKNIQALGEILLSISQNKTYEAGGNISKFQLGGKIIDPSKNIIPDGALHKNRNHLSEYNEELQDQITEKGIPVVSEDKEGNITQHAEVEVGEVIFNLANTEIIEGYWKQYKETGDESIAIECGKFITHELLRNTVDKAGIKKQVE